ncbi:hypothetical protein AA313_de0201172 [Arthrobotrys entomopaga]|nr:hypothetical protein AA313_de0201172 [Arthrobotrys entomopaga]
MKSGYLLAGASLLRSARAIPAYITTVYSCPDVMTITQTVYPPGWTNTGPVYTTYPLTEPQPSQPGPVQNAPQRQPQGTCTETGLSTSWETEYATRTIYYSEYGMYQGPPGCPSTIIAYMPTTVTCSMPVTTGWVGYSSDLACSTCSSTSLVAINPSVSGTQTYYTIWTEVYVPAGTTTAARMVGGQWTTSGASAPYVAPYAKACTSTAYNAGGQSYTGAGAAPTPAGNGAYPSINFDDPNVFNAGSSIEVQSAGYTGAGAPAPNPTGGAAATSAYNPPANNQGPYTWTKGSYPSINFDDPNVFKAGATVPNPETIPPVQTGGPNTAAGAPTTSPGGGTYTSSPGGGGVTAASVPTSPAGAGTTPPANPSGGAVYSNPPNFSDPNVFSMASSIEIVSQTGTARTLVATYTGPPYTVPSNFGANYASIDAAASQNFQPPSGTIEIDSLTPAQTFPPPITTSIPITSRNTANYPSINYADPSVFAPVDPNGGNLGGPTGTASTGAAPSAPATSSAPASSATSSA